MQKEIRATSLLKMAYVEYTALKSEKEQLKMYSVTAEKQGKATAETFRGREGDKNKNLKKR